MPIRKHMGIIVAALFAFILVVLLGKEVYDGFYGKDTWLDIGDTAEITCEHSSKAETVVVLEWDISGSEVVYKVVLRDDVLSGQSVWVSADCLEEKN